ncbi:hypothetical protein N1F78_14295 [Seonamhaeicola sp. MEBiC1930]|uniref:hypothetical protein n=1 Tax=Seonamhaeicola sp. MEBiC01930 TaxID=2976768 RepID=UPI0032463D3B
MIGKGKSISHIRTSISYGWNQEKDAVNSLKRVRHCKVSSFFMSVRVSLSKRDVSRTSKKI